MRTKLLVFLFLLSSAYRLHSQDTCCTCSPNLLYVTSDVYLVDQIHRILYADITTTTLISDFLVHLDAPPYGILKVFDAQGFENPDTLKEGSLIKLTIDGLEGQVLYYILPLYKCSAHSSLYVLSDVYAIDQVSLTIKCNFALSDTTRVSDFLANLVTSPGDSLRVVDAEGIENTGILAIGDKVEVLGANHSGKIFYNIISIFDAVPEIKRSIISIYPNPTSGNFRISGFPAGSKIVIKNMLGHTWFESFVCNDHLQFSLAGQSAGIYFILISNNHSIACFKLIVQ